MTARSVNMGEGPVLSGLLRLGGPAMLSMFFQNLYALTDTVFVARLGTDHLAALSLCIPLLYFSISLGKGISVGAMALMSQARGADDALKAGRVARQALPLAMVVLGPFCLLAIPAVNQTLFRSFGVSGSVLVEVDQFVFWLALAFPVMGFAMLCEGVFLSYGDSKTPMKAMIVGNLLNIGLDPFFIFTCKLGIAGASLASLIGWTVSGLIMIKALRKQGMDRPRFSTAVPDFGLWREILGQGAPVAMGMLVMPVSLVGLNYVLAQFGPAYIGAWNLSSRMEQMLILPIYGLTCSLIPFAGFNLGKGAPERIREAVRLSMLACYGVLLPCAALFWLWAEDIIHLFGPGPQVHTLAVFALRAAVMGYLFVPLELIMAGIAQGVKKPVYTFYVNAGRVLVLRIPLAFLFGMLWHGEGAYVSHPVSMVVTGMVSCFLLRHLLRVADESGSSVIKDTR